jgi:hypothetical protein
MAFEWNRLQQWLQAGLRKRRLLAKKSTKQKIKQQQRLQAQKVTLKAQQDLLKAQQHEQEIAEADVLQQQAASIEMPMTPLREKTPPMAAIVSTPPESYALMALPTVHQRPDLQVFINEALPTVVAEVDVVPVRPVVTPLVSDAAVRTLMAHHPQPESLAPNSETDRLLHHNRFLASSINNLAERYFSLQHQEIT